jgi:DeoR family ulaG and ulaABCDEF operon transcriptional repressor
MLQRQRHQLILDILDEKGFVAVTELTAYLKSSEATTRRDLKSMHLQGLLTKLHGGAQAIRKGPRRKVHLEGDAFLVSKEQHAEVKRRIAERAVQMCEDGETIIINGGSSTFMMGEYLRNTNLNILTNSFVLAQELIENSSNQVTMPGGEVYRKQGIILSAYENDILQYYSARKMFMGTPGISEQGVSESDALLIRSEQKLRRQADKLIVLADSSKIGKKNNFIFCDLKDVDTLITDSGISTKDKAYFEAQGIEIIVV